MCRILRRLEADAANNFANVKNLKLPNAAQCKVDYEEPIGFWCDWNNIPRSEFEKLVKDMKTCFPQAEELFKDDKQATLRLGRTVWFEVEWGEDVMVFGLLYRPAID